MSKTSWAAQRHLPIIWSFAPFTVGMLLLVRAGYPENFNSYLCDGRRDEDE